MPAMPTLPTNWTPNHTPTAPELKQVLDAINFLLGPPLFFGFQSTAQSLTSGAWTALNLEQETVDSISGHDTVTNKSRYTPTYPAWYLAFGYAGFESNGTGARGAAIAKNGTRQGGQTTFGAAVVSDRCAYPCLGIVQCNGSTDYIETHGFQSSGGALNSCVTVADIRSSLGVWLLSK